MKKNLFVATILLILLFVLPIIILSIVFQNENIWAGLPLGVAGTYEEYCERNRMEAFLRERMNSWSNLAFVWFGLIALINGIRPPKTVKKINFIQKNRILSIFTALSFLYLGIGSFLYHAALTKYTQLLDVAGTYAAIASIITIGILTLAVPYLRKGKTKISTWISVTLTVAIIADILFYKYKWQIDSGIVIPIMIVILLLISVLISISKKHSSQPLFAIVAFIAVIIAHIIRTLDVNKVFCNPDSLVQGHAMWHVLTGTGLFLMYLFFWRVEEVGK